MTTYIALLRGINVSGQKSIKMAELRTQLEDLGFANVQTYIQSGNIVFDFEKYRSADLENLIRTKILDQYGFEVHVMVKTPEQLEKVVHDNPFIHEAREESTRLFVTFLSDIPSPERVDKLKTLDYSPERWVLIGSDVYFFAANGYGKAKMNNNFFEAKLKIQATTRNWKTVNMLLQMARER